MVTRRIAAVMTVFNRREQTLRCLNSLSRQAGEDAELTVFVVDDASTDGTADAISSEFPEVRLVHGDGNLFWNNGMRLAFGEALGEGFDFYWWLNDDVELDDDALSRLLLTSDSVSNREGGAAIIVGSMRDPEDGHVTYGGVVRTSRWRPFQFSVIEPDANRPIPALTMNGNCVLIPKAVAHELGNISPDYRQKMGDFDYGLRAQQNGYQVWVAPGTYGSCAEHPPRNTTDNPLGDELRRLWSVKELPFGPWSAFTRRWGGPLWPVFFVSPYVRRSLRLVLDRIRAN